MTSQSKPRSQSVAERVRKWLLSGGFPLEMAVARALHDQWFAVSQSVYYLDEATSKQREIDVTAQMERGVEGAAFRLVVTFVIECKASPEKPWILMVANPHRNFPHQGSPSYCSVANSPGLILLSNLHLATGIPQPGFFYGPAETAYGCISAFRKGEPDDAYSAPLIAAKAARALLRKRGDLPSFASIVLKQREANWWVPLVVLDGGLFAAELESKATLAVREIKWGRLLLKNPDTGGEQTVVDIVTWDALEAYLDDFKREMDAYAQAIAVRSELATQATLPLQEYFKTLSKPTAEPPSK